MEILQWWKFEVMFQNYSKVMHTNLRTLYKKETFELMVWQVI